MSDYNIKENGFRAIYKGVPPFMKYEGGYGYIGVLLEDEETGKLQCHLCGHTVLNIAKHLYHKHRDISPLNYRKKVGLNLTTPLMSESTRKKIKNNFLNLTEEEKKNIVARLLNNNRKVHREGLNNVRGKYSSKQYNNKYGTCPEQAKTLFWEEYNKFGHIPTIDEMSGKLRYLVYARFSSYREALICWGVNEKEYIEHIVKGKIKAKEVREQNDYFPKFLEEEVRQVYQDFFSLNKRLPTWGEVKQNNLPGRIQFKRVFKMEKSQLENMLTNK